MGQAKQRLESVRQSFLAEIEGWAFPATEWEARTVADLRSLPSIRVQRYPEDTLAWMKMPSKHCHANAQFMEDNDPERRAKRITGWWIQSGDYVLHSVVLRDGQYFCVTPAPLETESSFDFVPDPKIEWRDEGEVRSAYRDGIRIGKGVRADPTKTLAAVEVVRTRLLSGMNPYEAIRLLPP